MKKLRNRDSLGSVRATPLATLLLALVAVPLARTEPRESRFRSFFIALAIYVGLISLTAVMRTALEQERIPRFPGLWSTYAVVAALLVVLVNPPRWRRRRSVPAGNSE